MRAIATPAVSGVPNFFIRNWLSSHSTVLWAVLGMFGVIDLLLALANIALGDPLAVLVNLVSGVVGVAGALVIQGAWRPDAAMLTRVCMGCVFVMWLSALWTMTTFISKVMTMLGIGNTFGVSLSPVGFIVEGIFTVAGVVLMMMLYGTAASVVKAKIVTN